MAEPVQSYSASWSSENETPISLQALKCQDVILTCHELTRNLLAILVYTFLELAAAEARRCLALPSWVAVSRKRDY
jgi:hypothetical protein